MTKPDSHNHQDWETVVFKKPIEKLDLKVAQRRGLTKSVLKTNVNDNSRKLDEETEIFKNKRIDTKTKELILKARIAKKITQKQLANQANLPLKVIADIESGRAIYDHKVIQRLKKSLGVA